MSKGLEALKELLKNHPYHEEDCDRVVIIEKELKALEIIKDKRVDVAILFEKNSSARHRKLLTQEEYDLLKEVLL